MYEQKYVNFGYNIHLSMNGFCNTRKFSDLLRKVPIYKIIFSVIGEKDMQTIINSIIYNY